MFNKKSSNADISQYDWAKCDRAAMLRLLHAGRALRVPGTGSSGFSTDVTGNDPRSVRAFLAGKGDLRSTWWNLYSEVYTAFVPGATLERAMYSFHSLHHKLTLARLEFLRSIVQTAFDIEQNGVLAATHKLVAREMKR